MQIDLSIIIALLTAVLSAGIAWGITSAKVKATDEKLVALESTYSRDHDILIELRVELRSVKEILETIKARKCNK